jgi:small ligand-binding sensory domain FIST
MKIAAALSTARPTGAAIGEVIERVSADLGGGGGDIALVFATADHGESLGRMAVDLMGRGLARHVLGCAGEAIVGDGREVEEGPALSLWVASLPGAVIEPVRPKFSPGDTSSGITPSGEGPILLLGDPFSFPTDPWLKVLREEAPGVAVIGGMASAGRVPGENVLVLDGAHYSTGAVGLRLGGSVKVRSLVSQGCRPIGRPMLVTKAEHNVVAHLGRRPAIEVLRELFETLDTDEQDRVRQGLHLGVVMNEYQESFTRGDFLVRNVVGADDAGGLAITERVRVGQTVQFHVRDADAADEDLRTLLADVPGAEGALLFTCNGRGTRMFDAPDHDVSVLRERLGPVPVAGFFAMGEIGPVAGHNHVHGFTASVALFGT